MAGEALCGESETGGGWSLRMRETRLTRDIRLVPGRSEYA